MNTKPNPYASMSSEQLKAIQEGNRNASEDGYFAARPAYDTTNARLVFCHGFDRGYECPDRFQPAQRKPLTYVDLRRIAHQCGLGANEVSARTQATVDNFARAIEAAHDIKENT